MRARSFAPLLLTSLWALPAAAAEPIFTYVGTLTDDAGAPTDATVTLVFDLFASSSGGVPLYHQVIANLVVQGGEVVAELGDPNVPIDAAVFDSPELFLQISVDGVAMQPMVRIAAVPYALRAGSAELATTAADADTLNGITPSDVALASQLATAGQASVAFANVTGVPAGIADGVDAVTTYTAASPLSMTGNTLAFTGAVGASDIVDGSITGDRFVAGAVQGIELDGLITPAMTESETELFAWAAICDADPDFATGDLTTSNVCVCTNQGPFGSDLCILNSVGYALFP